MWDRLEHLGWLHQIGAQWNTEKGIVVDLSQTPFNALHGILCPSFQTLVGQRLNHRKGFNGLCNVEANITAMIRQKLSDEQVGLLRALQIGTFITADQTGHFNKVPPENRVCKFANSQIHCTIDTGNVHTPRS